MRREKIQREYQIVRVDGIPAYYVFLVSIFLLVSLVVTKQERVFQISIYRKWNRFVALAQCKSGLPVKGGPGLKTPDATISALALMALRAYTPASAHVEGLRGVWLVQSRIVNSR